MKRTVLIRVVAAIVAAVFVGGTWVVEGKFNITWLKFFSMAVFLATITFSLWDFWIWRIPIVQKLPGVPRSIRGTWRGQLTSMWLDESGSPIAPKVVYLVVQQTSAAVSITLLTNESRSASTLAAISGTDGNLTLDYLYLNRPRMSLESRSRMHHGSAVLEISGNPAVHLSGRYWTDRDSKGELHFSQRSSQLIDSFDEGQHLFA